MAPKQTQTTKTPAEIATQKILENYKSGSGEHLLGKIEKEIGMDHQEAYDLLKKLESDGHGTILLGRRGGKTRWLPGVKPVDRPKFVSTRNKNGKSGETLMFQLSIGDSVRNFPVKINLVGA